MSFFTLASRLRARRIGFSLSQAACEPAETVFHSRGPPASRSVIFLDFKVTEFFCPLQVKIALNGKFL